MMLNQRVKYFFLSPFLKASLIAILFITIGKPVSAQSKKVKETYENGKVKETGKTLYKKKVGVWNYYSENGRHDHKEKWKNGKLRWAIYYTAKHRKAKTINAHGDTTYFKDCGCAP